MILLIDNYDSFVFNIARYLVEIGREVRVVRNDRIDVAGVEALGPAAVVLSPGPCGPTEAGACVPIVQGLNGRIPILGICLGHQCIAAALGSRVTRAREPMHGRASMIRHNRQGLFADLPDPLRVGRYHSLIVTIEPGSPLAATAWSGEGEVMALEHRDASTFGVQFHPESILTEHGHHLLANFAALAERPRGR